MSDCVSLVWDASPMSLVFVAPVFADVVSVLAAVAPLFAVVASLFVDIAPLFAVAVAPLVIGVPAMVGGVRGSSLLAEGPVLVAGLGLVLSALAAISASGDEVGRCFYQSSQVFA
jgi:hypothetical protein